MLSSDYRSVRRVGAEDAPRVDVIPVTSVSENSLDLGLRVRLDQRLAQRSAAELRVRERRVEQSVSARHHVSQSPFDGASAVSANVRAVTNVEFSCRSGVSRDSNHA